MKEPEKDLYPGAAGMLARLVLIVLVMVLLAVVALVYVEVERTLRDQQVWRDVQSRHIHQSHSDPEWRTQIDIPSIQQKEKR